jgi:hypothetical protein
MTIAVLEEVIGEEENERSSSAVVN